MLRTIAILWALLLALTSVQNAWAHAGHLRGSHAQKMKQVTPALNLKVVYQAIQSDYIRDIEPVISVKCAACHSAKVPAPWYAAIPLVGWLIQSDREEAMSHLEISQGFPFGGHGTPDEDLDALGEDTLSLEMPPRLYRFVHPQSILTGEEKSLIRAWVEHSQNRIADLKNRETID